ncbi:uncharacterized protein G2W53_036087 [Senna tora]|uniref:Uncharacterized protein n=1 Tax=Senna tora TaxID=362788 RepID=A0A834W9Z6_9FABA|nr:uncharacterized protein G2W53_036087 [Senna tora]
MGRKRETHAQHGGNKKIMTEK